MHGFIWDLPDQAENECGWADVAAVVEAVGSGNAYVSVHTDDGDDPPDTGPGDFPSGEIRGQIIADRELREHCIRSIASG